MADSYQISGNGDPSLASYIIFYEADDSAITVYQDDDDTTGTTEIVLSNVAYSSDTLTADDIVLPYVVTGTCAYAIVYDSNGVALATLTFDPAIALADEKDYQIDWPTDGISFLSVVFPAKFPFSVSSGGMSMGIEMELGGGQYAGVMAGLIFDSNSYKKSDEGIVTFGVMLSKASTDTVTVRLRIEGGKGRYANGDPLEDYGLGANYDVGSSLWLRTVDLNSVDGCKYESAYTVVQFDPNEVKKTVSIQLVNNPTLELDREMTVSLVSPNGCRVAGGNRTITITDDSLTSSNLFNVSDYGATGDGETDDTAAIEAAIAAAYAYVGTNSIENQAIVYFPNGIYRVSGHIRYYAGVSLWGESVAGVVIKRFGLDWLIENDYIRDGGDVPTNGSQGSWVDTNRINAYMFYNDIFTHATTDSAVSAVHRLTIDGDLAECPYGISNSYFPTSLYTLWEPSSGMQLYAAAGSTGRLTSRLDNVVFQNHPTTGLGTYGRNLGHGYRIVFDECMKEKSGYTVNGGSVYFTFDSITFSGNENPSRFDVEQNVATSGGIYLTFNNSKFQSFDVSWADAVALGFDRSYLHLNNCVQEYNANSLFFMSMNIVNGSLVADNCIFYNDRVGGGYGTIRNYYQVQCDDCTFYATDQYNTSGIFTPVYLYPSANYPTAPSSAELTNCIFAKHDSVVENEWYGVYFEGKTSQAAVEQMLTLTNPVINGATYGIANFGTGVSSYLGGKFVVTNPALIGVGTAYKLRAYGTHNTDIHSLDVTNDGGDFSDITKLLYLYAANTTDIGDNINWDWKSTVIPVAAALIDSNSAINYLGNGTMGSYPNGIIALNAAGDDNTVAPTTAQDGWYNMQYKASVGGAGGNKQCTVSGSDNNTTWDTPA